MTDTVTKSLRFAIVFMIIIQIIEYPLIYPFPDVSVSLNLTNLMINTSFHADYCIKDKGEEFWDGAVDYNTANYY